MDPPSWIAAYRCVEMTIEQFRGRLEEEGVIAELRRLHFWLEDEPSGSGRGFTFGDLWSFYNTCGRSAADLRVAEQEEKSQKFTDLARRARRFARDLRWAVASLCPVHIQGRENYVPLLPQPDRETLLRAADIIDIPHTRRQDLIAPLDFAEQLAAMGRALRRRGRRRDALANRFVREWPPFAREYVGGPLWAVGAKMFTVISGHTVDANALQRRARRARVPA